MVVQSISFPILYWSMNATRQWLRHHNYYPIKPAHFTQNFIRYRLSSPKPYYRYKTIVLSNGVHLTLGL